MYEEHPIFKQPTDEDGKVWRYMDFTKLVSFLESGCLYFSRADKLGDPFEGSLPRRNVEARRVLQSGKISLLDRPEGAREQYLKHIESTGEINQYWLKFYGINCWHMNEHESAAMWNLYLKSNEGVAIQSTYRKLRESIIDDERVFLGKVEYIDYENAVIDDYYDANSPTPFTYNPFSTFVHKRKSFEHEHEVRALVWKPPTVAEDQIGHFQDTIAGGVEVRVDVTRLVERIYVAPSAPEWFPSLVSNVAKRYGFAFEVVTSKLDERPVF